MMVGLVNKIWRCNTGIGVDKIKKREERREKRRTRFPCTIANLEAS